MHPLLILVLVFDLLIAVSSVLNLVNMMRVNLMVEERRAEEGRRREGRHPGFLVRRVRLPGQGRHRRVHLFKSIWQRGRRARFHHRGAPQGLRCAGAVRHRRPPAPPPCPAVDHGGCILGSAGSFRPPLSRLFSPPSRLFGTRLFPCGPLTHRLPGRGTMPGKYKYKGRQLWNY